VRDLPGAGSPEWSPDGKSLAILSGSSCSVNINIINMNGSDLKPITNVFGDIRLFTWQPNNITEPVTPILITPNPTPSLIDFDLTNPNDVIAWFSDGLK
jgi:hypothetical protein